MFFGSARALAPEDAEQQLKSVQEEIRLAGSEPPALAEARERAEKAVRFSRYYRDAMELARRLTEWSKGLTNNRAFVICSGGSGGIMEAANRGASMARGKTMGLNIQLPMEQAINSYVSRDLISITTFSSPRIAMMSG